MNRTNLEVIAPSVDEAISRGVEQFGVPRDQLNVEILDEGSKGFLGIGGRQVRIRLTLKSIEAPQQDEITQKETEVKPSSAKSIPALPQKTGDDVSADNTSGRLGDHLIAFTNQVTTDLLEKMKIKGVVSTHFGEADGSGDQPVLIDIKGDDLSVLIGRRSETLNALQYILALIVSKEANHWIQVIVDVEGYRARRERQLRQLARRMADQTTRTGKRQLLEPMSAAERRIIHLELRDHETVTTESVGDEPNRKVSIILKK